MPGDCTDIRGIFSAIFWPWKSLQVHATSNSNQSVDCLANYPSPVSRCKLSQPRRPHSSISSSRFLSNSLQLRPAVWMMAFSSASLVSSVTEPGKPLWPLSFPFYYQFIGIFLQCYDHCNFSLFWFKVIIGDMINSYRVFFLTGPPLNLLSVGQ